MRQPFPGQRPLSFRQRRIESSLEASSQQAKHREQLASIVLSHAAGGRLAYSALSCRESRAPHLDGCQVDSNRKTSYDDQSTGEVASKDEGSREVNETMPGRANCRSIPIILIHKGGSNSGSDGKWWVCTTMD